jgi:predicted nucleic acid-binding protein
MDKILIDTDVLLDFFFDIQPFSEHAAIVLSYCEEHKIEAYITPVILSNVYYLLRKNAKHEYIIEKLRQLFSLINILIIDKESVLRAMNSDFKDFEDALQNYAAEGNESIQIILTRNLKDFKYSKLAIMTPEHYIKLRT